jgi:hypothetical protein
MLDEFKKIVNEADSERMTEIIPVAALELPVEQIETASFVFWLVYMAETDLNDVIVEAWKSAIEGSSDEEVQELKNIINTASESNRSLDPMNLTYFIDKVFLYQTLFGKDERTVILWQLHEMRNHISHNRIDQMQYLGNSLIDLDIRKQILIDYMESMLLEKDLTQSPLFKSLSL